MGAATVDRSQWRLVVTGLVEAPFTLTLDALVALPRADVTSVHECYGSPVKPPTTALWRVGNVKWTGVRLRDVLARARPLPAARYVWSDGLDHGAFAGVAADRYRKDVPLSKAMRAECLIAYEMNGRPLSRERGWPVRLVVPGWFGTNSTKWLCRLTLAEGRAESPFTTRWYNEVDPIANDGRMRPVWDVEINSMIVRPRPEETFAIQEGIDSTEVSVKGWAWSWDGVKSVQVIVDDDVDGCVDAGVEQRTDFSWQEFNATVELAPGRHRLRARAVAETGIEQPLVDRRNHVHTVEISVEAG